MQEERKATPTGDEATTVTVTLALTPSECELVELALGQLLAGARREEHLIPEIRALQSKIRAAAPPA